MKLISLLLLASSFVFGQGNETVFQKLFTNSAVPVISAPVRNIGQTSHIAFIIFTNAPAQSCTNPTANGHTLNTFLQGSYDNNIYFDIGSGVNTNLASVATQVFVSANNPYPYIKLRLTDFDITTCVATAWYSGAFVTTDQRVVGQIPGSQDSLFQQLLTNVGVASIANVKNTGQTAHSVFVLFSDATPNTCISANIAASVAIEASYDKSTWFQIGTQWATTVVGFQQSLSASGPYPYVRLNLSAFDTTNCIANAWYSGSYSNTSVHNTPDTTYQKLFGSVNVATVTLPVKNIGQVSHSVFILFNDKPTQTCTATTTNSTADIEASEDNITWYSISSGGGPGNQFLQVLLQAQGAHPYIRFNLSAFDTTKCIASAWYAGSFSPTLVNAKGPTKIYTDMTGSTADNPVYVGGVASGRLYPLDMCTGGGSSNNGVSIGVGTTEIIAVSGATVQNKICGFAFTAGADATVKFVQGDGTNCGSHTADMTPAFTLIKGVPLAFGNGLGVVMQTSKARAVCLTVTGSTVNGVVASTLTYYQP